MVEILQRATPMKVVQIEDGIRMEPNRVYLNPPEKEVALLNYIFQLTDLASGEGFRLPIDYFFRTLAEDMREKAVGVILSGTGSDGSQGLRAIKENGGDIASQSAHSGDQRHALRYTDSAAGVEDVEQVRTLQGEVKNLPQGEAPSG